MKNLHILPTDKQSRLVIDTIENKLYYQPILHNKIVNVLTQHIYITNNEDTRVGDYVINIEAKEVFITKGNLRNNIWIKKIVLTTDQDLIKDGVQAIDDEFLEWFVKNPSCEEVEVEEIDSKIPKKEVDGYFSNETLLGYKIIIPKEEPKQETHICKYCNAETTQSDDECYAKPKQEQLTAVEWLAEALGMAYKIEEISIRNFTIKKLIEQANKMFEEQIIDAHNNGKNILPPNENGKQYYNETFK